MKRGWYVNISDTANCYMYGPFKSKEKANSWVIRFGDAFHGRIIHVIDQTTLIKPDW